MNGKERVNAIFNRKPVDRHPFWLGNPADDAKVIYAEALGIPIDTPTDESEQGNSILKATKLFDLDVRLHEKLGSDLFWASPELDPFVYQHPEGKPMFDIFGGKPKANSSTLTPNFRAAVKWPASWARTITAKTNIKAKIVIITCRTVFLYDHILL